MISIFVLCSHLNEGQKPCEMSEQRVGERSVEMKQWFTQKWNRYFPLLLTNRPNTQRKKTLLALLPWLVSAVIRAEEGRLSLTCVWRDGEASVRKRHTVRWVNLCSAATCRAHMRAHTLNDFLVEMKLSRYSSDSCAAIATADPSGQSKFPQICQIWQSSQEFKWALCFLFTFLFYKGKGEVDLFGTLKEKCMKTGYGTLIQQQ